jgi:hypothetical protein
VRLPGHLHGRLPVLAAAAGKGRLDELLQAPPVAGEPRLDLGHVRGDQAQVRLHPGQRLVEGREADVADERRHDRLRVGVVRLGCLARDELGKARLGVPEDPAPGFQSCQHVVK